LIRSYRDLDLWRNAVVIGRIDSSNLSLILRPDIPFLRDSQFAHAVGDFACEHDMPVQLEGSILSHAFYLLRSMGVSVIGSPRGEESGTGSSLPLNKLVRDRVPSIIQDRAEDIEVVHVSGEDLVDLLRAKIVEEATELLFADSDSSIEEAADVYEALVAFLDSSDIVWSDLVAVANRKREMRGGFNDGIVLISTRRSAAGLFGVRHELPAIGQVLGDSRPGHPVPIASSEDGRLSILMSAGVASSEQAVYQYSADLDGLPIEVEVQWGPQGISFRVQRGVENQDGSADQLSMGFE